MEQTPASDLPPGAEAPPPQDSPGYWHELIPKGEAARFLGLTERFLEVRRQRGGGPRFIVISSRCIRYRRLDLRAWSEARLRSSTSDHGAAA